MQNVATAAPTEIVLGTHNAKKRGELEELLRPMGIRVKTLADFPAPLLVEEVGTTFGENARLKAVEQARHLGAWVLGEDSGLCVDALHGGPGVYSARYAGEQATDDANNALLLECLARVPASQRGAHYVCHVVLSDPQGMIRIECEDTCRGRIRPSPRGSNGFGYDPLFEVLEYRRTFGELGPAVKSLLSHRARAMRRLVTLLSSVRRA